jgi:diacylglycerol kinase (ATP)
MIAETVQLFVAPRAGWFAHRRIAALHRAFEQAGATVLVSESVHDKLQVDPRATHVCAVGGDGTVRHVIDAVHRSGRNLSISVYPAGTVNLLARECGYTRSPQTFVRRALNAQDRAQHHTALVGGTPLVTCASVGPDSFAVEGLSSALKARIGGAAYLFAFGKLLIPWPRAKMTLSWGQNRMDCEAVYIAKGRFFAGPWTFAPEARALDPLLHVVSIQRASRLHFVQFAWKMLWGLPVETIKGVHCFTCTELTIGGEASLPLQADGDIVTRLPAFISVRRQATEFA